MIKIIDLKKSFNGQEVLKGVNLDIQDGETTAIIGRSGGGKSVLLKHLVGLVKPDSGEILVNGIDITKLKGRALNEVKKKFGMVFQGAALFDSLTVLENVAFPLRELTDLGEDEILEKALYIIKEVGLVGMEHKYPDEISGGMGKRVALARAMISRPEFMFFDEPTTGLDPVIETAIHILMKTCMGKMKQCTDVLISHNMKEVLEVADKVAMLHEGVIIEITTPKELLKSSNPYVKQFVSGSIEGPIHFY